MGRAPYLTPPNVHRNCAERGSVAMARDPMQDEAYARQFENQDPFAAALHREQRLFGHLPKFEDLSYVRDCVSMSFETTKTSTENFTQKFKNPERTFTRPPNFEAYEFLPPKSFVGDPADPVSHPTPS